MYMEYWNLRSYPFEETPDPDFLYMAEQYEEALARLRYVIEREKGAGILSGVFGCGKTTLINALLRDLPGDLYRTAVIRNPRLGEREILHMILYQLSGEDAEESGKSSLLIKLEKVMKNNLEDGRKSILIIDEAHSIEEENVFEELRLLMNLQNGRRFLSSLILSGQPDIENKIENMKQFSQRISIRHHLGPLSSEDTVSYIRHRVKKASGDPDIFTDEAALKIAEYSGGIPRRINQISDMCLLSGYLKKSRRIEPEAVREASESIGGSTPPTDTAQIR